MRTAYLSGPMRGHPQYNFPAFFAAEQVLVRLGWNVLNPARMDLEQDGFDPDSGDNIKPVDHYLRRDFEAVMSLDPESDLVVTLPQWDTSKGSRFEVSLAQVRGVKQAPLCEVEQLGGFDANDQVQEVRQATETGKGLRDG